MHPSSWTQECLIAIQPNGFCNKLAVIAEAMSSLEEGYDSLLH